MTNYYTTLQQDALLHIAGPDTLKFLQGQVTCDTRKLDAGHALLGAYCTPQGRVVCDFLLCQLAPEHCVLRMRRAIREHAAAAFGKYIIFSKAKVDAGRDDWHVVTCWGDDASRGLREVFGTAPREHLQACAGEGFALVQIDGDGKQFECYVNSVIHPDLPQRLAHHMAAAEEDQWRALQVVAGVARIEAATVGEFIPQMLNYDLTGHISFNKGCYTGQEVVARLHYRGKAKRRLYLARIAGAEPLAIGAPLYAGGTAQSVGNLVNSATDSSGASLALVTATAPGANSGLHLASADGPAFTLLPLPYSVEPT